MKIAEIKNYVDLDSKPNMTITEIKSVDTLEYSGIGTILMIAQTPQGQVRRPQQVVFPIPEAKSPSEAFEKFKACLEIHVKKMEEAASQAARPQIQVAQSLPPGNVTQLFGGKK